MTPPKDSDQNIEIPIGKSKVKIPVVIALAVLASLGVGSGGTAIFARGDDVQGLQNSMLVQAEASKDLQASVKEMQATMNAMRTDIEVLKVRAARCDETAASNGK